MLHSKALETLGDALDEGGDPAAQLAIAILTKIHTLYQDEPAQATLPGEFIEFAALRKARAHGRDGVVESDIDEVVDIFEDLTMEIPPHGPAAT
jgi:hypothetical protein